jgi:hypothetical protein
VTYVCRLFFVGNEHLGGGYKGCQTMGRRKADGTRAIDNEQFLRDRRRQQVGDMYARGYVAFPIATLLNVNVKTVTRDIDLIRKEWLEQRTGSYDDKVNRELAGIEQQESQLWEAWYRSCQIEVISTKTRKKQLRDIERPKKGKKGKDASTEPAMVVIEENEKTVTRQMIGDPRFQAEITRLRELRCKLQGLLEDAPPSAPVVNIWQQLQEMKFDRDRDEIEEQIQAVRMLPPRPSDDAGLKDVTGYKDVPDKHSSDDLRQDDMGSDRNLPSGFTDLDDDKTGPSDDTPLDIPKR